ncbi:MAG: DnaD domain protein [Bacilli bacterium]
MIKITVLPADTYIVINKTILSDKDRNILIMLYQPLIGSLAISLYFTLWSYLDKLEIMSNEWTHHHLMGSLKIRLEYILEAREKLEAIGLIKTYYKENNGIKNYVYELYSPMSAHEFLTNPILSTSLYNNIGNSEYDKTIKYFKKATINLDNYQNITSSFSDVFETANKTQYELISEEIKKSNKRTLEIIAKIDLNDLFALISDEILNKQKVTRDIKDLIYKLSFIYNLDNDALNEIIRNSINEKKNIDSELLKENARKYYQFENGGKLPSIIYKNQPEYLRKETGDTSNRAKIIYTFETTSPYDFLSSKQKGSRPSKTDLSLLEYLLIDLELKPGVVNVLIDFVLKISNNKLVKAYVETIATQWKRSNIEKVEDAMDLASKEYNKPKNKSTRKSENKPEWFNKDIEAVPLTEEEKVELTNMLKEFK